MGKGITLKIEQAAIGFNYHKNSCYAVAISIASDIPYNDVYGLFNHRLRYDGTVTNKDIDECLEVLTGKPMEYCRMSFSRFVRENNKGSFVVWYMVTKNFAHMVAVKDGIIYDDGDKINPKKQVRAYCKI